MTDEFDFKAQVLRLQSEGYVGPDEITEKVLADMTTSQLLAIARPLVRDRVRFVLRMTRTNPVRPEARPKMREAPAKVVPITKSKTTKTAKPAKSAGVKNSATSWRKFDPDERLQRKLSGQFSYGGIRWGVTGDLILDQVRAIAADYHKDGQVLVEHGLNWDALAKEMVKHKAKRVRDLPRSVLVGFFLGEEAA